MASDALESVFPMVKASLGRGRVEGIGMGRNQVPTLFHPNHLG